MKKLIGIAVILIIQQLAFNTQYLFAQVPNDNIGSGNCLEFDGLDDFVIINPMPDFPSTEITVSFWINTDDVTRQGASFSYAIDVAHDNEFVITDYQNFEICINDACFPTGVAVNDGEWHHVAVTWSNAGGNTILYIDGVLRHQRVHQNGATLDNGGGLVFGQDQDAVGGGFQTASAFLGMMDEICIWNRVLSQTEIRDNMCKQLVGNETDLVGYWNMNEGSGATVSDLTTNANHGIRQ